MNNLRTIGRLAFLVLLLPLAARAQGDKVLAQVADGTAGDGTQFITKLRITNLGPVQDTEIKNLSVLFFLQNGKPWTIATNLGTASSFPLDLGAYQTIALNTAGTASTLTSGYAIVRNTDSQTIYAEDYEVAVTAFYEVRKGGSVIDTISVPVSQPTVSFVLPVEIDDPGKLYTGFAIVNLSGAANGVSLQLFQATTPSSAAAPSAGTQKITLDPNGQRAVFLYPSLFPSASSFKGMLRGFSDQPIAILALLQTPTPSGVQYATMVSANIDSLRRNSNVYLREGTSLDADLGVGDYFWDQDKITTTDWEDDVTLPWDLLYERQSDTQRRLTTQFTANDGVHDTGARFAVLGTKSDADFDNLTIADLQGLTYSSTPIDMSNSSPNLAAQFAFAIKTNLGRYAKARVAEVITFSGSTDQDLVLELFTFK